LKIFNIGTKAFETHKAFKGYHVGTTDEYFEAPYEEYPVTICGQTIIVTNGKLAAALFKFRFDEQEG